jgi:hypothetical protein
VGGVVTNKINDLPSLVEENINTVCFQYAIGVDENQLPDFLRSPRLTRSCHSQDIPTAADHREHGCQGLYSKSRSRMSGDE